MIHRKFRNSITIAAMTATTKAIARALQHSRGTNHGFTANQREEEDQKARSFRK
jgi:hypothetical protein